MAPLPQSGPSPRKKKVLRGYSYFNLPLRCSPHHQSLAAPTPNARATPHTASTTTTATVPILLPTTTTHNVKAIGLYNRHCYNPPFSLFFNEYLASRLRSSKQSSTQGNTTTLNTHLAATSQATLRNGSLGNYYFIRATGFPSL